MNAKPTSESTAPIAPKNDAIFKRIFSEKHLDVIKGFLTNVLKIPHEKLDDIQVRNPHLGIAHKDGKQSVLDLLVTNKDYAINVELQVLIDPYMCERILYYVARTITDPVNSGENYDKIKSTVCVLIYFPKIEIETGEYHIHHNLKNDKGVELHRQLRHHLGGRNLLDIHLLLPWNVPSDDDSELANWLRFLSAETKEELDMVAKKGRVFSEACDAVEDLSADPDVRLEAERHERARRDEWSRQQYAENAERWGREMGEQKGEARGRKEEKLEIARNLLRKKMSYDFIAETTSLTLAEVERLAVSKQN